jgi:hypothetical protein
MVIERTWHRNQALQTSYTWNATSIGIEIDHDNRNPSYVIPWPVFSSVLVQARTMANNNGGNIVAGISRDNPSPGSVGEWVNTQNFNIMQGVLTSGHLSFLGPIFGRMGFIQRQLNGNSIVWEFV